MRILMLNSVCGLGSTGRICTDIAKTLIEMGHEVLIIYGRKKAPADHSDYSIRIGNDLSNYTDCFLSRIFDNDGFNSVFQTKSIIKEIEAFSPDVVHIHNLHGYYINIDILFYYLKSKKYRIIWTFHDCWPFTGHCSYFDYVACDKWKDCCSNCKQKKEYPTSWFLEKSYKNYRRKKDIFTGLSNLTIVTPSEWLAKLVGESFLKDYDVRVINNGIDTNVFTKTQSNVNEKYNIPNKKIILGVAAVWSRRKGFESFVELAKYISDEYVIVLVGLDNNQLMNLPQNVIGIERTDSTRELAELYSTATVFVNPTLEDNYPTTNIEAISCGTPVITYNTGGSPESARLFGKVVPKNNVVDLVDAINSIEDLDDYDFNMRKELSKETMIQKYIDLYLN